MRILRAELLGIAFAAWLFGGNGLGQSAIAEGDRYLEKGKIEEALQAYDREKQSHPGQLQPYLKTARALLREGRTRDAGIELNGALQIRPSSDQEALKLAQAVADAGHPVIAAAVLEDWQQHDGLDAGGWQLLAELLYQQRQFDRALDALDRFERLSGGATDQSILKRAMILLEKGALEKSMAAFEDLAGRNPRSAEAFHGLSKVCLFGNNPEAALSMSEKAVERDPSSGIYLYQLGVVLKALGRNQEAIARLEEAESRGADAFGVSFDLGDAYRKAGDVGKARETLARYQTLLEEKRRDQEAIQLENQGAEQLQKGDLAGAVETFQRLVEIDPDNWEGHNRLAKIALTGNRIDQAMDHVERLLALDPSSSEAHFLAALCWNARRDRDRALDHAETSKRLRPGNPALRNLLGNLYFGAGEWQRAAAEYRAASLLEPDNGVFRANLESALRRAGEKVP